MVGTTLIAVATSLSGVSWASLFTGGAMVAVITGVFMLVGKKIDKGTTLDESVQSLTNTLVKLQKELDAAIERLSNEREKARDRDRVIEGYQDQLFEIRQLLRQTRSLLIDVLIITSGPVASKNFAELHNRVEEHSKVLTEALAVD